MNTAELIPFNPSELVAFSEFEQQLNALEAESRAIVPDLTTKKGIEAEKSHIYKWRQSKTAVTKIHKEAKAEALEYGRKVDAVKNKLLERIESVIADRERPLKEIEEREMARVDGIRWRIIALNNYLEFPQYTTAQMFADELARVEQFEIDDTLQEFKAEAAIVKNEAMKNLKDRLSAKQKYEAEQDELQRLRQQAQEQVRKDRESRIAQEAAEKATREAEAKAQREAVAIATEAQRKAQDAEREELRRVAELETAKREKAEAEKRALAAEGVAKERAERETQERIRREKEDAERREANKKHRARINNAAVNGLVKSGLSNDDAVMAVTAIARREVPNVTINY